MKYLIEKVGAPGNLHIEAEDILRVQAAESDAHALKLVLRPREEYSLEEGYSAQWDKSTISLVARQAQALIEQDRAGQSGFCNNCYDYGKRPRPEACARCQVIDRLRREGKGDLRKVRPAEKAGASTGMSAALLIMVLLFWWTLCQWAETSRRLEAEQADCKKERIVRR